MSPLALVRLSCAGAALAAAAAEPENSGTRPRATEVLDVREFKNLHVATELQVTVTTGDKFQVSVSGSKSELVASVDSFETLVLALRPGARSASMAVDVIVSRRLPSIRASSGARVTADKAGGALVASSGGSIRVHELLAGRASISAAPLGKITVGSGRADDVYASVSSRSEVSMGEVKATRAVISVASQSRFSGLVAERVTLSVSSGSSVSIAAARELAYSCTIDSELTLPPNARLTEHAGSDCRIRGSTGEDEEHLP